MGNTSCAGFAPRMLWLRAHLAFRYGCVTAGLRSPKEQCKGR